MCASVYLMACSIIMLLITKLLISGGVLFLVQETVLCIYWKHHSIGFWSLPFIFFSSTSHAMHFLRLVHMWTKKFFFCIIFCSTVKSLPADAFLRSFVCFLFYVWLSTVCTINLNSFCMVKCWVNNCIIRDCCGS